MIVMGKLDVALINARILWRQISYQQSDTGPMQYFLLSILCVTLTLFILGSKVKVTITINIIFGERVVSA